MLKALRTVPADPLLAEGRIAQHMLEGRSALVEDLLAVRDEQQSITVELSNGAVRSRLPT